MSHTVPNVREQFKGQGFQESRTQEFLTSQWLMVHTQDGRAQMGPRSEWARPFLGICFLWGDTPLGSGPRLTSESWLRPSAVFPTWSLCSLRMICLDSSAPLNLLSRCCCSCVYQCNCLLLCLSESLPPILSLLLSGAAHACLLGCIIELASTKELAG